MIIPTNEYKNQAKQTEKNKNIDIIGVINNLPSLHDFRNRYIVIACTIIAGKYTDNG
jgi:hypothetical protein